MERLALNSRPVIILEQRQDTVPNVRLHPCYCLYCGRAEQRNDKLVVAVVLLDEILKATFQREYADTS